MSDMIRGNFYQQYPRAIEQVATADVRHVARKYLTLDSFAMVVIRLTFPSNHPEK
jgi:predicted Zn-dependent peptidase